MSSSTFTKPSPTRSSPCWSGRCALAFPHPWSQQGGASENLNTGKRYRGVNVFPFGIHGLCQGVRLFVLAYVQPDEGTGRECPQG